MIIAHNILAEGANRQLGITNKHKAKSSERLASGYRLNRAADNVAGLSVTEEMRGQIRGLGRGNLNCVDGISLINVADGAIADCDSILHRIRELCVQAANDTYVSSDRRDIEFEIEALTNEIDRVGRETEFNTIKVLQGQRDEDGIPTEFFYVQDGANSQQMTEITLPRIDADTLGMRENIDVSSGVSASKSLEHVVDMLNYVSDERSRMGAYANRLEFARGNDQNTGENLQSAESRMRDADMADEVVTYSKSSIIQQAGQSMLAQANSASQGVLTLLNG